MTHPSPSSKPEQPAVEEHEPKLDEAAAEVEVPLNRAERRARAKKSTPSHVGPAAGRSGEGHGPRSHTKRQIG